MSSFLYFSFLPFGVFIFGEAEFPANIFFPAFLKCNFKYEKLEDRDMELYSLILAAGEGKRMKSKIAKKH